MSRWHHPHNFNLLYRRGPSRLLWFIIGGATTAWWIRRDEWRETNHRMGFCRRPPIQAPPSIQPMVPNAPFITTPTMNHVPQHPVPSWNPQQWSASQEADARWEEDKARMQALGRQAGDKMADLSEHTLDTVMSTVEALKAKLAEHRAEREKQQKALDEQLKKEAKEPHRWV